jgi:DNA-binding response OmpR family regulator
MKILIVEDQKNIANSLKKGFLDEGFQVDVSYDGETGYENAAVNDYDCMILDLMLPKLSGETICKNLRKENNLTPIIILTARSSVSEKVLGLEIGADDYMVKPFSFVELLARVRAQIRRSNEKSPVLTVDNLELNPNTHIVKRAGKEIFLTGKEYTLLEYLMNHSDQVLTRDQIIEHVWDYSYDNIGNIVDVFINRLRSKLEAPFKREKKIMHTIRNVGYRFGVLKKGGPTKK